MRKTRPPTTASTNFLFSFQKYSIYSALKKNTKAQRHQEDRPSCLGVFVFIFYSNVMVRSNWRQPGLSEAFCLFEAFTPRDASLIWSHRTRSDSCGPLRMLSSISPVRTITRPNAGHLMTPCLIT